MIGSAFVIIGVFLIIIGFVLHLKPTLKETAVLEPTLVDLSPAPIELKTVDEAKEKGNLFEGFVVTKFSKEYFTLKEWVGDKYVNGIYAQTTTNPDLLIGFTSGSFKKEFAVECKYRSKFKEGKLRWAYYRQIENYRKYEATKKIPVFVAIGVGGDPDNPNDLFVVPLNKLRNEYITQEELQPYRKSNFKNGYFYFDAKKLILS